MKSEPSGSRRDSSPGSPGRFPPVRLAEDGEEVFGGEVYVAPEGVHSELACHRVRLRAGSPVKGFQPAADRLFRSLAEHGCRAAAVMLTDVGKDGLEGAQAIGRAGEKVVAQDRASCVVFGMPGAVAAGVADLEVSVELPAASLAALTSEGREG